MDLRSLIESAVKVAINEYTTAANLKKLAGMPPTKIISHLQAKGLPLLGKGSARTVFLLDPEHVIKVALNDAGKEQNAVEAKINSCTSAPIFAQVTQTAPDYSWIIMEKATPLKSDAEFSKMAKLDLDQFRAVLTYWYAENMQTSRHNQYEPDEYEKYLRHPLVKQLIQVMKDCDMLPGDFARASSWGRVGKKLVLIDYGLSRGIYLKHYYGR